MSAGSGKVISMVEGISSSAKSNEEKKGNIREPIVVKLRIMERQARELTFLNTDLSRTSFWLLLLGSGLFGLHTPYLNHYG
jgi:hypothetical protein